MSGLRAFSAGFLHRGNTFLPFPPQFYDFPSPQRVETPSSEEREEISIDRKESKLHANFSYRSNSLSPSGNKNLILARFGLELFFLSFKFLQRIGIFSPLIEGDGINSNRVVSRAPLPLLPSLLYSP